MKCACSVCDINKCTRVEETFLLYNNKEEAVFPPPSCAVGVKAAVFIPLHQRLLLSDTAKLAEISEESFCISA